MGLFKHFKSKSRAEDFGAQGVYDPSSYSTFGRRPGRNLILRLPEPVLQRIFSFVCPHCRDTSFLPSEESQIGDGCMLCDLRDVATCARVCRQWYGPAQKLLYTSVRIDAVHYCALEDDLAEQRKKTGKHFRPKSVVEPVDVPTIRLQLLCRTVKEQPRLANQVQMLKLPYMTRETAKADLARLVSALPNLQFVDLPDGFFTGDPSCLALRQELHVNCPEIRRMTYKAGSEEAFELLAQRHWQAIEVLELSALAVEPATLRIVLGSLPVLHELTLSNMTWMDDSIFQDSPGQLPAFPALQALKLINVPNITADGLVMYLASVHNREKLTSLSLQATGITVTELPDVLWAASCIQHLSITETVTKSLALTVQDLQPLTSISLRTLQYEITSSDEAHGLQRPADSYYVYLANSLHQNALPALETLYVRDQEFPDLLLFSAAPAAPLPAPRTSLHPHGTGAEPAETGSLRSKHSNVSNTSSSANRNQPNSGPGFHQTLEVYAKGLDELEWVFTSISAPSSTQKISSTGGRPLSQYSASGGLGPQWAQGGFGGEARKSVVVGNGFGGFLAVPQEDAPRPRSAGGRRWGSVDTTGSGQTDMSGVSSNAFLRPPSTVGSFGGDKRSSRHDLWR